MDTDLQIKSAAVTDRGLSDKRPQNEDAYLEMPKVGIFAVADGVGGQQAGEVASQMAMEILGEAFIHRAPRSDAEDVMRAAIERANASIYQMGRELPQLANMASTVVALHVDGNIATIAHVGDSRAYSVSAEGELRPETEDHSVVAEEVRAGRMTAAQAENHPGRNIISRALGSEMTVEVDIRTVKAEPGTTYLLCSDGITRHVTDDEIKGVLEFGGEPADICEHLKGLCFERGAEDNLTALVVKIPLAGESTGRSPAFSIEADDEPTVATARSPFDSLASEHDIPAVTSQKDDELTAETPVRPSDQEEEYADEGEPIEDAAFSGRSENFTKFGGSEIGEDPEPSSKRGGFLAVGGALVAGLVLGLGIYHFALLQPPPAQPEPVAQPLSEMRTANIPFSTFEENRRNVDRDPAGYLAHVPAPKDAEDQYLRARAYVLTGDYDHAAGALKAAEDQLKSGDPTNMGVLRNDIAILRTLTNDWRSQAALKRQLDAAAVSASNTNSNSNALR